MDKEIYIFEVSEKNFSSSVLLNSNKLPVIVEFMGVWSEPCVSMADQMARLATEFADQFIFAKVDIDEQPVLRDKYKIENIPTLLVFWAGEVTRQEVGQLTEQETRLLLRELDIFHQSDLLREQAREKHLSGASNEAVLILTQAIKLEPWNTRIAMDMVQIILDTGQIDEARSLFARLPEMDQLSEMGKLLRGQLWFRELAEKTPGIDILTRHLQENQDDFDARFDFQCDWLQGIITRRRLRNFFMSCSVIETINTVQSGK